MDNKDADLVADPVLVAQQRVDSLTTYLAQMMDDDDVTLATL